jgi:hypothetical protein
LISVFFQVDFGCGSGSLLDALLNHPTTLEKLMALIFHKKVKAMLQRSEPFTAAEFFKWRIFVSVLSHISRVKLEELSQAGSFSYFYGLSKYWKQLSDSHRKNVVISSIVDLGTFSIDFSWLHAAFP